MIFTTSSGDVEIGNLLTGPVRKQTAHIPGAMRLDLCVKLFISAAELIVLPTDWPSNFLQLSHGRSVSLQPSELPRWAAIRDSDAMSQELTSACMSASSRDSATFTIHAGWELVHERSLRW